MSPSTHKQQGQDKMAKPPARKRNDRLSRLVEIVKELADAEARLKKADDATPKPA